MDDALVVRGREPSSDLHRNVGRFAHRHRALLHSRAQRFALKEFSDDEHVSVVGSGVVNREDVLMREGGNGLGLALEPGEPVSVLGKSPRQDLDGHVPPQPGVMSPVDLAHAAHANQIGDFIRPKAGSRGE